MHNGALTDISTLLTVRPTEMCGSKRAFECFRSAFRRDDRLTLIEAIVPLLLSDIEQGSVECSE